MQPDGMAEHYLRTNDPVVLSSISAMARHITRNFIAKAYTGPRVGWPDNWEGRIQERAMLATMAHDALAAVPGNQPVVVKDDILATQNPDGSWTPSRKPTTAISR